MDAVKMKATQAFESEHEGKVKKNAELVVTEERARALIREGNAERAADQSFPQAEPAEGAAEVPQAEGRTVPPSPRDA